MPCLEDAIEVFANQQAVGECLSLEQYILNLIGDLENAIGAEINVDLVFSWLCKLYLEQQVDLWVSSLDSVEAKAFKKEKNAIVNRYMLEHLSSLSVEVDVFVFLERHNRLKYRVQLLAAISALQSVFSCKLNDDVATKFEIARLAVAEIHKQPEWFFSLSQSTTVLEHTNFGASNPSRGKNGIC